MFNSKIFGKMLVWLCYISIVILSVTFFPGLPPDIEFVPYTYVAPPLDGPLSVNSKLNKSERLFENEIVGPEDFAVYNNELYTGCHGGLIYKITPEKLISVLKTGKPCDGLYQEHICGRPLGLKFDKSGSLYIADAYYGLLKANITTGEIETLVSMDEIIDGHRPMIPNGLVITKDFIYWTDSSTVFSLNDGLYTLFGNGKGRLIKYIIAEKRNEVLLKNINFANGLAISNDGSFLIIAETFNARLLRYYLTGPKKGSADVFINLPGFPDNINSVGNKYIVSLIIKLENLHIKIGSLPLLRKFLARSIFMTQYAFRTINYFYPHQMFEKMIHWIGHFEMLNPILGNPYTLLVTFDSNGKILDSFHGTDATVSSISAAKEFNNYYYLGSPFNKYLGRCLKK